jgi:hypothetical protein
MNLNDQWFVNEHNKIVAGLVQHGNRYEAVGDTSYLPASYGGKGLGRLERKPFADDDNEAPEIPPADVLGNLLSDAPDNLGEEES